jgi:hypothetical protein
MKITQTQGREVSCQVLLSTNRCLQREREKPCKQPPDSFFAREKGAADNENKPQRESHWDYFHYVVFHHGHGTV